MSEHMILGGKNCVIYTRANPAFVLLQPVDEHDLALLDKEEAYIRSHTDIPYLLAAFHVENWNRDLSPWNAPAVFGNENFGDGASATLDYLTNELTPAVRERYQTGTAPLVLGGYSLAGLFSLWCACQSNLFSAIAAASPSVWFPGWMDFVCQHTFQVDRIYLSLGDREEKARNPVMAAVGGAIRQQYELLQQIPGMVSTLEWNPGNHFRDSEIRTAKAFLWVMSHL